MKSKVTNKYDFEDFLMHSLTSSYAYKVKISKIKF